MNAERTEEFIREAHVLYKEEVGTNITFESFKETLLDSRFDDGFIIRMKKRILEKKLKKVLE